MQSKERVRHGSTGREHTQVTLLDTRRSPKDRRIRVYGDKIHRYPAGLPVENELLAAISAINSRPPTTSTLDRSDQISETVIIEEDRKL